MDIQYLYQFRLKLDHGWLFESKLYTSVDRDENLIVILNSFNIAEDHLISKLKEELYERS